MRSTDAATRSKAEQEAFEAKFAELQEMRADYQQTCVGRRLDVQLVDGLGDRALAEEMCIDTTVIHPNCKSRHEAEFKSTEDRGREQAQASVAGRKKKVVMGRAVKDQENLKRNCYAPLMAFAEKQEKDGKRLSSPKFYPAVCSTFGECGAGLFSLQERIIKAYLRDLDVQGPRLDGYSPSYLSAVFREDFKASVQVAVAKGVGRMLLEAGLPR